jgi:hypothetical protein
MTVKELLEQIARMRLLVPSIEDYEIGVLGSTGTVYDVSFDPSDSAFLIHTEETE